MSLKIKKFLVSLATLMPFLVLAQNTPLDGTLEGIITKMTLILGDVIPVLLVIATLVFIWGIITYILAAGSDQKKKEGYNLIIWGLVGLFVIVTVWGLVTVIGRTFDIGNEGIPSGPALN